MSVPLLSARNLRVAYPGRLAPVLDAVSLDASAGDIIAVLGPTGAGKSSLLRVLAGLQRPVRGTVCIDGEPIDAPHPRVALAFQHACLLPWLSVAGNVAFGLTFARQPRLTREERRARVEWALAAVGLAHAQALRPSQLSGGMAQRVTLARLLARRPRLLLLDEPFAALDEVTRADMQQLLLRVVRHTRAAAVLVTHDIDEALRIADRIVLLGGAGRVAGTWAVEARHRDDPYVAELDRVRRQIVAALRQALSLDSAQPASPLF